jgi:hypothetical protein
MCHVPRAMCLALLILLDIITRMMLAEHYKAQSCKYKISETHRLVSWQLDRCFQQWQPTVAETRPRRTYQKCPSLWWADPRALCQYQEAGDMLHSSDAFQMLLIQTLLCGEPDLNPSLQLEHQSVNRKILSKICFQITKLQ